MRVTQDDLLDALRSALTTAPSDDGFTGPELARTMGCGENKVRQALRALLSEGRLDVITLRRQGLDGRAMSIKGYRLRKVKRAA